MILNHLKVTLYIQKIHSADFINFQLSRKQRLTDDTFYFELIGQTETND